MKIALITPANKSHMPYLKNYEKVLSKLQVDYDVLNWDRLHNEDPSNFSYRDSKKGIERNLMDYLKYAFFLKKKIKSEKYSKLIIFGLPLLFFLRKELKREYLEKYYIDIRDKNKIIDFFNFKKIFEKSRGIVISSEKYIEWLYPGIPYIINHNTLLGIDTMYVDSEREPLKKDKKIIIKSLGTIRDFEINKVFLESLEKSVKYNLEFVGDGEVITQLENICTTREINNVTFSGRYNNTDEEKIIKNSNLINVLRYPDSENNRTALPNRLYSALKLSKPLVAYEGTYLSEVIQQYGLGIVLSSFDSVEEEIDRYLLNNMDNFHTGRIEFLSKVKEENELFVQSLEKYIRGN